MISPDRSGPLSLFASRFEGIAGAERQQAVAALQRVGLPTRRVGAWKYTAPVSYTHPTLPTNTEV